ncbi:site-2 protease family protein [Chitinispirillales bacterium ANBcel5]|uniref:site-2 protease family protein n=1 Tax=Cellulosispirillum alkaliphilum TaxID=3039283 RepID=UPI002A5001A5|nr:site-2 protease family protein [Chitinispirillales bacterium ANBcel5]
MFGKRIKIIKLLGFEVYIDLSWIIIAVLIVWSLAQGVFPVLHEGLSSATYWWMGVAGAAGLFISIVLHELSHSLVARRFGLPMKSITLFVFGGVAEMDEEPPHAKAELLMALAGPVASVIIGVAFWGLSVLGQTMAFTVPVLAILGYLSTINIVLAIFNMLPAFPLDGGRVFRAILWGWKKNIKWATRVASGIGAGFGLLLVAIGIFSVLAGGIVGGLWWALIGLFIRSASKMSYESILVRGALEGESVEKFTKRDPVMVSADTTVDHLVEDYIYRYHFNIFPVENNGKVKCIDITDFKNIPRQEWERHRVEEYAKPFSADNSVQESDNAMKALTLMNRTGKTRLMVLGGSGDLVGTVAQHDLLKYLSRELNLEYPDNNNRSPSEQ